ncbi:MAG: hypothetical protein WC633_08325 [Desulfurivibrionaceae bacterium]
MATMDAKLNRLISEQIESLRCLYKKNLYMPFLMVLYATIDIFGFVTATNETDAPGQRFRSFTHTFMMKYLKDVTPDDLWGARCAILHTGTPESDHSRKNKARQILYSWGTADSALTKKVIAESDNPEKYVATTIESLSDALMGALCDLQDIIERDTSLRNLWGGRIKRFYSMIEKSGK